MNGTPDLTTFPINYSDRNGQPRNFLAFPDPIQNEFGHRCWEFRIVTQAAPDQVDLGRFFQLTLIEREDGWWRIDMIGQRGGYTEFECCGCPDEVILAVARRFHIVICSSTPDECQVVKARRVWLRLQERFTDNPGDYRVEEREGRFWLTPTPVPVQAAADPNPPDNNAPATRPLNAASKTSSFAPTWVPTPSHRSQWPLAHIRPLFPIPPLSPIWVQRLLSNSFMQYFCIKC
jgi:hypothetical protein